MRQDARRAWLILWLLSTPAWAGDGWPQWRGPHRDGRVSAQDTPHEWSDSLTRRWQVRVGEGHSSPVVADGHAFLLTRRVDDEVVTAIDIKTGEVRWETSYPAPIGINPYATGHGRWPRSTPLLAGETLVTLGAGATLCAWRTDTGELRWRRDPDAALDTSQLFCATAMSPLLHDGTVVVHTGDDGGGALVAFDLTDGEERWRTTLEGPGYASPMPFGTGEEVQLVTLTMSRVIGVSAADGQLQWSFPFDDRWNENIVTPVIAGPRVIVAGVRRGAHALLPQEGDDEPEVDWSNAAATFYMSSPLRVDDVIYGFTKRRRGQLVALDVETGATLWSHDEPADSAAVLVADDRLVVLTTGAELIVGRPSRDGWSEERRYSVGESPTWAHPVILRDAVLVKDADHLTAWWSD